MQLNFPIKVEGFYELALLHLHLNVYKGARNINYSDPSNLKAVQKLWREVVDTIVMDGGKIGTMGPHSFHKPKEAEIVTLGAVKFYLLVRADQPDPDLVVIAPETSMNYSGIGISNKVRLKQSHLVPKWDKDTEVELIDVFLNHGK